MDLLLKFLVHSLKTIDGKRDSAAALKTYLIKQDKRHSFNQKKHSDEELEA